MSEICLEITGVKKSQVNELLADLNSIQGVSAKHLETKIEFKDICVPIIIEIGGTIVIGVVVNLITDCIKKFFEKEKSIDNEPITIEVKNINIVQGDSKGKIENNINVIINQMTDGIETTEQVFKGIPKIDFLAMRKENVDCKPLTLVNFYKNEKYIIIDQNGEKTRDTFDKNEIITALKENNNDIKKAFGNLIKNTMEQHKEWEIQEEIENLKSIEERRLIREEAEKRLYGKVKENVRIAISEKDKEVIFNKFDNKCGVCNKTEGLHIHHKDYNPSNNKLDNVIVLCGVCHKKIHMKVR